MLEERLFISLSGNLVLVVNHTLNPYYVMFVFGDETFETTNVDDIAASYLLRDHEELEF